MANLTVAGFGDADINGTYVEDGTFDGYAFYKNGTTSILGYYSEFGPYSFTGSYYIVKTEQMEGSIPIYTPKYKVISTDPTSSGWISMVSQSSGENTVGTVS